MFILLLKGSTNINEYNQIKCLKAELSNILVTF